MAGVTGLLKIHQNSYQPVKTVWDKDSLIVWFYRNNFGVNSLMSDTDMERHAEEVCCNGSKLDKDAKYIKRVSGCDWGRHKVHDMITSYLYCYCLSPVSWFM